MIERRIHLGPKSLRKIEKAIKKDEKGLNKKACSFYWDDTEFKAKLSYIRDIQLQMDIEVPNISAESYYLLFKDNVESVIMRRNRKMTPGDYYVIPITEGDGDG